MIRASSASWLTNSWLDAWLPHAPILIFGPLLASHVAAGPHLFDAGELAAAAWGLGGSHPPGQPLHALVAHAFARLVPFGPLAARMALASATFALVAAHFAGLTAGLLCELAGAPRLRSAARFAATCSLVLSPIVMRQSLRIEVYTVALCATCMGTYALTSWASTGRLSLLLRGALCAGLAAAAHPPHAGTLLVLGALFGLLCQRQMLRSPSIWLAVAVACLVPLIAVYALLPIRAHAGAAMWGEPSTPTGLLKYVSGEMYVANSLAGRGEGFFAAVLDYLAHMVRVTSGIPCVGALLMLARCSVRARRLVAGFGAFVLAACAVTAIQPLEVRNPDNVAYLGPAIAGLIALGAAGLCVALARNLPLAVAAIGLLIAQPSNWSDLREHLRGDLPALETLTAMWTDSAPPRALVVASTDATAANLMHARALDGARPDAALFVSGLAASTFHWKQLAPHPAFDGKPRVGTGQNKHARLLQGLLSTATPAVPIYLEHEAAGYEHLPLAGPGLVGAHGVTTTRLLNDSIAERLSAQLARDRKRTPDGDHGLAAGILRAHELTRARRLIARGHTAAAMRAIAYALPSMEGATAQRILQVRSSPVAQPAGLVEDPGTLFLTRDEAERDSARHLWALGQTELALEILRTQAGRGVPRSLLQLAHLQAHDGLRHEALEALTAFLHAAPQLAHEAGPLPARLRDHQQ